MSDIARRELDFNTKPRPAAFPAPPGIGGDCDSPSRSPLPRKTDEQLPDQDRGSPSRETTDMTRRRIRQARLAAHRAGPHASPAPRPATPLQVCDPSQSSLLDHSFLRIVGYQICEEVSHGGQARVFRGVHEATGRIVALKVLNGGPYLSSSARTRFEREVKALASLDHPNIVNILDQGRTADGSFYLAMNYIEGRPLDDFVAACPRTRQTQRELVALCAAIARAVGEAHLRGIVHRDLKPSNIRVDARRQPHILDFGLVRLVDDTDEEQNRGLWLTRTGNIIGSLPWASPEQAAGAVSALDARSDVYSLGVIFFQILSSRAPYLISGPLDQVIHSIRTRAPVSLSSLSHLPFGAVHSSLASIVAKMLAKDAAHRYPNATAVAADLRSYLDCKTTAAAIERRRCSRRRLLAPAAATLTLALAATLLSSMRDDNSISPTPPRPLPSWTNTVGMRFVQLPAGKFLMSSPQGQSDRRDDEVQRLVHLTQPFLICATEVTRAQYRRVIGQLPNPDVPGADDLPVDGITWHQAVRFCEILSQRESVHYRLPTEAQWEYACQAELPSTSYGGAAALADVAWHAHNSRRRLHPVAARAPNAWGLFDMHGNVAEWCSDGYRFRNRTAAESDPVGDPRSLQRVLKGGSAYDDPGDCSAARRIPLDPSATRPGVGFRVVRDASP